MKARYMMEYKENGVGKFIPLAVDYYVAKKAAYEIAESYNIDSFELIMG